MFLIKCANQVYNFVSYVHFIQTTCKHCVFIPGERKHKLLVSAIVVDKVAILFRFGKICARN